MAARKESKGSIRVFVYGTLKRGHHNHGLLERGQFLGYDTISGAVSMVSLGGFPGVVQSVDAIKGLSIVYGEVYAVDAHTLGALDLLEGYAGKVGRNFYDRRKLRTDELDLNCWVYTLPVRYLERNEAVPAGCWCPTVQEKNYWNSRGVDLAKLAAEA